MRATSNKQLILVLTPARPAILHFWAGAALRTQALDMPFGNSCFDSCPPRGGMAGGRAGAAAKRTVEGWQPRRVFPEKRVVTYTAGAAWPNGFGCRPSPGDPGHWAGGGGAF